MALDFVLARPDTRFLASESDKVGFLSARGIEAGALPQRRYRSERGPATTLRYFLDKFPIFVCDDQIGFTFISGDTPSQTPLQSYLNEHWPLFSALGTVLFVFATSRPELVAKAEGVLSSYAQKRKRSGEPQGIASFFALRHRHESGGAELSITELRMLREGLQRYRTPQNEALYRAWCVGNGSAAESLQSGPELRFEAAILPYRYDLFGDL